MSVLKSDNPAERRPGRIVAGYAAGASVPVFVYSALVFSLAPVALLVGTLAAILVGCFVVLPIYVVLRRFDQLRIWWATVLGYSLFTLPGAVLVLFTEPWHFVARLMLMKPDLSGPDWPLFLAGSLGALGGLVGWVVAYGFRLRPEPPTEDALEVFD